MDLSPKELEKVLNNNAINLKSAPNLISEFIVSNDIPINGVIDFINVIVTMSENNTFLFSYDQWPNVFHFTCEFIKLKRDYLDDCYKTMDERDDNLDIDIAHFSILQLRQQLGNPPPYSTTKR